jgi:hypothetical protein
LNMNAYTCSTATSCQVWRLGCQFMSTPPWRCCILVVEFKGSKEDIEEQLRWHLGVKRCHEASKPMVVSLDTSFGISSPYDLHV